MFDKWRKYSYVAQKQRRLHLFKALIWLFVSFLCFSVIGSLFVSTVVMENATMEPGILKGERFVVSPFPYGARLPVFSFRMPGLGAPSRGDLVVLERSTSKISGFHRFANAIVRFFTGQRLSGKLSASSSLKRVVGVPGDTLSMEDHVIRVKPLGDAYGLTEFELTSRAYDIAVPKLPEKWSSEFPFSGNMDPIVLAAGEYFLVSDDRSASNDSRVWGPVSVDSIVAKVMLRYWPLSRFGRP